MGDFFNFEKKGIDFPFYNHIPEITKSRWLLLLISIPIATLVYGLDIFGSEFISSILFCLIMLIPLLYVANWDYKLFFQKPTTRELGLAVLLFIGYMLYSIIMDYVLLSPTGTTSPDLVSTINIEMLVSLIFSMMAEELTKFIPFIFLMRVFFKYSENRKFSLVLSAFIVMLGFGLMHYDFFDPNVGSLISVLLLQGLGSIFEFYGLIKTKNILVSYTTHLLTDAIIMILILLGF